jgi:hypothetical protein
MNSGWYFRDIEQLQQSFTDTFVDSDKDTGLFTTIANPFEAQYENDEPTSELKLHCSDDELGSKFKEGDLSVFLKANIQICGRRQLFVHDYLEALTYANMLSH